MTTEKQKAKRYTTKKLPALYAHTLEPDFGTKDYPDPDGSFNITLKMTTAEYDSFIATIQDEIDEGLNFTSDAFDELKPASKKKFGEYTFNKPGIEEFDRETEEATGNWLVRFKTKASYKNKQDKIVERRVPIFDSMAQAVKLKNEIGYGSLVKISFTVRPYFVDGQGAGGLSLYLDAIQLLKLEEFGARNASAYGFGEEDDDDPNAYKQSNNNDDDNTDDSATTNEGAEDF